MAAAGAPDGMEEPGMDTEAEAVVTEAPSRPLNCVEAEAAAGAAAEDSCDARDKLQPARPSPLGTPRPTPRSATGRTRAAAYVTYFLPVSPAAEKCGAGR